VPQELRAKLDTNDPRLMPEVVLNAILVGTGIGAVIPAMMQKKHLENNCRAVMEGRFSAEEIGELRRVVSYQLSDVS
jgi:hypothetical protein